MTATLNLAARPFVNRRPWRRLTALLWALGLALLTFNAVLYWGYLTGSADARGELSGLREQLAEDGAGLDRLSAALDRLDVQSQNREVAFLNERIADRRFPWGQLFNDIEQALPWDTRLRSLAPQDRERSRRRQTEPSTVEQVRVILDINGEAQDDDSLHNLLDSLWEHPSFDSPNLSHESRQDSGPLDFAIVVAYTPETAASEPDAAPADAPEAEPKAEATGDSAARVETPPAEKASAEEAPVEAEP